MEAEYESRIARCDRSALLDLWKGISRGNTPGWGAGKALEYLVLRAFQLEGAEVCWPCRVSVAGEEIEQIDGVVYAEGLACVLECKDQARPVNIEPIAKLRNQLLRRPSAAIGIVVSRGSFTQPAMASAQFISPQTILLWNGYELEYALQEQLMRDTLRRKYRYCVEHGLAVYNILQRL